MYDDWDDDQCTPKAPRQEPNEGRDRNCDPTPQDSGCDDDCAEGFEKICREGESLDDVLESIRQKKRDTERRKREAERAAQDLEECERDLETAIQEIGTSLDEYEKSRRDLICRLKDFEEYLENQRRCLPHAIGECADFVNRTKRAFDDHLADLDRQCEQRTCDVADATERHEQVCAEAEAAGQAYRDCRARKDKLEECFDKLKEIRGRAGQAEDENCLAWSYYLVRYEFAWILRDCPEIPTADELRDEIREKWCEWRDAVQHCERAALDLSDAQEAQEQACEAAKTFREKYTEKIKELVVEECCQSACEKEEAF